MVNDASPDKLGQHLSTDFLSGGGEMEERIRALDWSNTPLGPIDLWPQSLKTSVSTSLGCAFPIILWWGPELVVLYNDEYRPMLGAKHPGVLGQPGATVWSSIWDVIGPMLTKVLEHGEATRSRDLLLHIDRYGYPEEAYFSFSYSPIRTEHGRVGGVFCPVIETTDKVIGERRLRTLRDLAAACQGAESEQAVFQAAASILAANAQDVPFAIIYRIDEGQQLAQLVSAAGIVPGSPAAPHSVRLQADAPETCESWSLDTVVKTSKPAVVADLATHFGELPTGAWKVAAHCGIVLPILLPGQAHPSTVLAAAVSPMRPLDADYRTFFELLATQIASGLADAKALEEERRRAEALAEIDRAKTAFFSNVSHEFRTPLTLMLGPIEDALRAPGLPVSERERLEVAHRNSLRLLKLVNSLLDFSRIEAGRVQATYEPTDLAELTAQLASNFRSACERAGLTLLVDCPPLSQAVHVDRDMWEKIILNLLSNAFKFTFEGEIAISLCEVDGQAELTVRDTGVGVPQHELPRLFERFHRIEGQRSRTHEGSGIGLALVQELVKLHGGVVRAESGAAGGTTFTVTVPLGTEHLPRLHIGSPHSLAPAPIRAEAFVQEALRWLPDATAPFARPSIEADEVGNATMMGGNERPLILIADDNADMRGYLCSLLDARYDVEAVADGEAALAAIGRRVPDLVLADIMMPRLDGLGLLARLRSDPQLRTLPTILLSARAGEEARVEGLAAGADDYLIKPFSARELLSQVAATIHTAKIRRETEQALRHSEERFRHMADNAPMMIWVTESDATCSFLSKSWYEFTGQTPETGLGFGWLEAVHPDDRPSAQDTFVAANANYEAFRLEYRLRRKDGEYRWAIDAAAPRLGSTGEFLGYIGSVIDITERKQAEETQQLLIAELNHRVKNTLASVQAIVQHTLRSTGNPADFAASFSGRIQSMARVHSLLSAATWQGADLHDLIRDQTLSGPVDESRVTAWGPPVQLSPQSALHFALMLHELGTNSNKYGALSQPNGVVTISWAMSDDRLRLTWAERGGPLVRLPFKRGFGTTLIEQSVRGEGGTARLSVGSEGVTWEITLPLPRPSASSGRSLRSFAPEFVRAMAPHDDGRTAKSPSARLAGKRFLVVEDEPLVALDIVAGLEDAGAKIAATAGTTEDALRIVENTPLDAALLDGNLRGEPVDEIAAALTRKNVPFLFITGYGRESLPKAFGNAGMLSKPFSAEQLLEAAAQLVQKPGAVLRLRD